MRFNIRSVCDEDIGIISDRLTKYMINYEIKLSAASQGVRGELDLPATYMPLFMSDTVAVRHTYDAKSIFGDLPKYGASGCCA